jgi:hypothetical protein
MPIQVKCQCGKTLKVKDELAGKAVKCPGCGKVIKVGQPGVKAGAKTSAKVGASGAKTPPARPAAPASPAAIDSLDDLFDEEGFSDHVAAVCPNCREEMGAGAVLCTKCGFNKETGELLQAHRTAGVDVDHGTLALEKAEADMAKADRLQKEMLSKAGMPTWMLALVIFGIGSATLLAVIAVNMANRTEEGASNFNAMQMFLQLIAGAFGVVSGGAIVKIWILYAKKEAKKKEVIKLSIGAVVMGGIAVALLVASNR